MIPDFLNKLILSLISGFSELIFVSSSAHQLLYRTVSGFDLTEPALFLAIHLGILAALMMNCQKYIKRLRYEKRLQRPTKRRRGRQPDPSAIMNIRILNAAVIPLALGFLAYPKISQWAYSPLLTAVFLLLNGIVLFIPRLLHMGNKNALSFTQFDGFLMGLCGILGMIPGLSRIGCMYTVAVARGADKDYALELSTLLSIPALCALIGFDLYGCSRGDAAVAGLQLLVCILAAALSFGGAYFAFHLIRYVVNRSETTGFAYYSWGLAVFLFLLYLIIP